MLRAPDQSRLTVTNQTSLAKLKRFSEQAGGNAKIRGDRNVDGKCGESGDVVELT